MKRLLSQAKRAALLSLITNFLLAIVKGLGGLIGHSDALIADAIESCADIFSSFLVLLGLQYAHKPADEDHPYGHGKAEPLITFAVVGFLLISATIIAVESIRHLNEPQEQPEFFTLYILGAIILIKELSYRYVYRKGVLTHSTSLKADAWHHRSDAISSLIAFLGILSTFLFGKGFEKADDWAALIAALFIVYNAYRIFRPALGEIMDEHTHHEFIEEIRIAAKEVPGVIDIEKCWARKNGMTYVVDLHLELNGELTVTEGHGISHDLKDHLMAQFPSITDVLIHIEPAPLKH
ncbi:MAG: cation diffusion facilitator family transporter [Flavobacteriales bacterium]